MPRHNPQRQHQRGGSPDQREGASQGLTIEAAAQGKQVEFLVVYNRHLGGISDKLKTLIRDSETAVVIPEGVGVIAGLENTYNRVSQNGFTDANDHSLDSMETSYYYDFLRAISGSRKSIFLLDQPAKVGSPAPTAQKEQGQQGSGNVLTSLSDASVDDVLAGFLRDSIIPSRDEDTQRERGIAQRLKENEGKIAFAIQNHFKGDGKGYKPTKARIIVIMGYMHQGLEAKLQGQYSRAPGNIKFPKGELDEVDATARYWETEKLLLAIKQGKKLDIRRTEDRELLLRALFENLVHMYLNPDLPEETAETIGGRFKIQKPDSHKKAQDFHELERLIVANMTTHELTEMLSNRNHTPLSVSLRGAIANQILPVDRRDGFYDNTRDLYAQMAA